MAKIASSTIPVVQIVASVDVIATMEGGCLVVTSGTLSGVTHEPPSRVVISPSVQGLQPEAPVAAVKKLIGQGVHLALPAAEE